MSHINFNDSHFLHSELKARVLPLLEPRQGNNKGCETNRHTIKKKVSAQPAFTCSKLTIETLEQGVKYVQS